MAENITKPTRVSVDDYLAERATASQQADCRALMAMLEQVTGQPAVMWGPSIVGFGSYRYVYASGHTGEAPWVGFAVRGREVVLYVLTEGDEPQSLLAELGPHRTGKVCLYFKRLSDLDLSVLGRLIACSVADVKRRYP